MRWTPTNPTTNDVDLDQRIIRVMGKGSRERVAYLTPKAARALDRYVRARRQHAHAELPYPVAGRPRRVHHERHQPDGARPGATARVAIHPHSLRHYYADTMLSAGMQEGDLMALAGWRSREMLARYAAARRSDRAIAAARRLTIGDDL